MAQDGFDFDQELALLVGDINGDGVVDARDGQMASMMPSQVQVELARTGRNTDRRPVWERYPERYEGRGELRAAPAAGMRDYVTSRTAPAIANHLADIPGMAFAAGSGGAQAVDNMLTNGRVGGGAASALGGATFGVLSHKANIPAFGALVPGGVAGAATLALDPQGEQNALANALAASGGGIAGAGGSGYAQARANRPPPPTPPAPPPVSPTGPYAREGQGVPLAYQRYRPLDIRTPEGPPPAPDMSRRVESAQFFSDLYANDRRPETNALLDAMRFNPELNRYRNAQTNRIAPTSQGMAAEHAKLRRENFEQRKAAGNAYTRNLGRQAQDVDKFTPEVATSIFNNAAVAIPEFRRALDAGDVNAAARFVSQSVGVDAARVARELRAWLETSGGRY